MRESLLHLSFRSCICHSKSAMKFGVISDTHGLLRPEALAALRGVDRILHLGDIGPQSILDRLAEIAPVTAIRGNVDHQCPPLAPAGNRSRARRKPSRRQPLPLSSPRPPRAPPRPCRRQIRSRPPRPLAHAQLPHQKRRPLLQPSSPSPRRLQSPVTVGLLTIDANGGLKPEIVYLPV